MFSLCRWAWALGMHNKERWIHDLRAEVQFSRMPPLPLLNIHWHVCRMTINWKKSSLAPLTMLAAVLCAVAGVVPRMTVRVFVIASLRCGAVRSAASCSWQTKFTSWMGQWKPPIYAQAMCASLTLNRVLHSHVILIPLFSHMRKSNFPRREFSRQDRIPSLIPPKSGCLDRRYVG